jgi:predicted AAA+ superfamily ATPase
LTLLTRPLLEAAVRRALSRARAVVLTGPRQAGKTTLARRFVAPTSNNYFDLEDPFDLSRLEEPMLTLANRRGLVVIDEVQRRPDLFPQLRVLLDRSNAPGQFLLLGSASPVLLRQAGESLLGRVESIEISGFDLSEIGLARTGYDRAAEDRLWLRGGFPRAYLAASDADSHSWCTQAIASHVELDLPQFGVNVEPPAMLRFWRMLAHMHGQVWSAAPPASSLGVSEPTVRRYLDTLTHTLMLRQLLPWHENLNKRQVKAPKVYFRDSGLLHALLNINSNDALLAHPRCGASWEGFAVEQVLRLAQPDAAYFWATHQGAELDLFMLRGDQRIGVEVKRTSVPALTRAMHIARTDLRLDTLYIVYPGEHRFHLAPWAEAVPLWALLPPRPEKLGA